MLDCSFVFVVLVFGGFFGGRLGFFWGGFTIKKEGNALFNNALNTFYFMVIWHWTNHSDNKRGIAITAWTTLSN